MTGSAIAPDLLQSLFDLSGFYYPEDPGHFANQGRCQRSPPHLEKVSIQPHSQENDQHRSGN
jgi:hypothetical protein